MPSTKTPYEEGFWARTRRKNAENPFIAPAVVLTCYGLYRMSITLFRHDRIGFQNSQRLRVGAQMAAFAAFVGGIWYQDYKKEVGNVKVEKVVSDE
ncbi:hypothetical protein SpCBS45565_g06032 [Spizellomyces sp. 'palustris']|nr:hypothetical protein SpCBS45565_g06032 [Spizellomyces sp. 'palustris']